MKSIDNLSATEIQNIKLLCFDCDGVITKKGTEIEEKDYFNSVKTNAPSSTIFAKLAKLQTKYHLCVNSGRGMPFLIKLFQPLLWQNISLISEIGIFVLNSGEIFQTAPLTDYELTTIQKIRQELAKLIGDSRVKGFEPKQFLTTLHCHQQVPEVSQIVAASDPEKQFYSWWNEEAYDINPARFNKKFGLMYLMNWLHLNPDQLLTVGNGVNDLQMTGSRSLNISTNPTDLQTDDYFVEGEEIGGEKIIDHLLKLNNL